MSKLVKLGSVAHETRNFQKLCQKSSVTRDANAASTIVATCPGVHRCIWATTNAVGTAC